MLRYTKILSEEWLKNHSDDDSLAKVDLTPIHPDYVFDNIYIIAWWTKGELSVNKFNLN